MSVRRLTLIPAAWLLLAVTAEAEEFTHAPPGELVPDSGTGRMDSTVYVPGMRFPIEKAPAFANSQVWGVGGSQGPAGSECDSRNYSYPWHDNFCERLRDWEMPLCPTGQGHQGQDIRASSCADDTHWAVAAEAGTITSIGSYSVYLMADSGTRHRYLHMARSSIAVTEGERVARDQRLGRVSDEFGGGSTTIHLHYDLHQNVSGVGNAYVPTYMSLVRSYEALLGIPAEPCKVIPADGDDLDDAGPCFYTYGPPRYWRQVDEQGYGGSLHWTNAWDGEEPGNWARWQLSFAEAGRYEVQTHVVAPYNRATRVRYQIRHAEEETDVVIDQSAAEGWVSLGAFEFAEGGAQAVEVFDNTGETAEDLHITADAVRIRPERDMEGEDAGLGDAGHDAGEVRDAGSLNDAGGKRADAERSGRIEGGCACRSDSTSNSGSPQNAVGLALALLLIRGRARIRR